MTVAFILIFASQVVIVIAECVKRCRPNSGVVIAYVVVNLISGKWLKETTADDDDKWFGNILLSTMVTRTITRTMMMI